MANAPDANRKREVSPILRWLLGSPEETVPDPVSGLSSRDKTYIIDTWTMIRRDMRGNAVSLFVALFARYPEYQRMFRAFKDVPLEELPRNGVVKAHALAVFYFITVIIESMDDNDLLTELVRKNARNHLRRPVGPEHYANMTELLIEVMQDKLRSRMAPAAVRAWKTLFAFLQKVTVQVFAEHRRAIKEGKPLGILTPPALPASD
ncbi:globin-like [Amblyomma americanum]